MVVERREGNLAIVTDGSGGYLVVEIIDEAETFREAEEIMEEELENSENDEEEEEGEEES